MRVDNGLSLLRQSRWANVRLTPPVVVAMTVAVMLTVLVGSISRARAEADFKQAWGEPYACYVSDDWLDMRNNKPVRGAQVSCFINGQTVVMLAQLSTATVDNGIVPVWQHKTTREFYVGGSAGQPVQPTLHSNLWPVVALVMLLSALFTAAALNIDKSRAERSRRRPT